MEPAAAATPEVGADRRWRIGALAVFAVGVGLYARTTGYEFVDWDDVVYVVENPWIRSLSAENLGAIFSQPLVGGYTPLHVLGYLFDYAVWELDPFGYHLHSVLLNALNGALAFCVVLGLSRQPAIALSAALLFAVHHSHVESVAWVSGRKEVLFTAFLLLATLAHLRAHRGLVFGRGAYAASVALFALGAAAKSTIIAFPLFFLLVDRTLDARRAPEHRRGWAFHLAAVAPYFLVALPFVWMNLRVQPISDSARAGDLFDFALVKGHAVWRYGWVLLGVLPGQPLYDPPPINRMPLWAAATLAPLALAPAVWAHAMRRGHTDTALALGWLSIGLLPPILFPLTTYMADRYLYAPSLGFCWLLATGIATVSTREWRAPAWNAAVAVALTAVALWWFAAHAWSYTPAWRNSETLWTYAAARSLDGRAATALSAALIRQQRFEEAEQVLTESKTLGANGYLHLAILYLEQNRTDDALRASEQAIAIARIQTPTPTDASKLMWIRGVILAKLGRDAEAIAAWEAALVFDPANRQARAALDARDRL
jgi:hypothetical protein